MRSSDFCTPFPQWKPPQTPPCITFATPLSCESFLRRRITLRTVKHYTIDRIKGGMRFTCTRCEHSVSTLEYNARAGKLRTQAATAINQHATKEHQQPLMYSSLDPQQRICRAYFAFTLPSSHHALIHHSVTH